MAPSSAALLGRHRLCRALLGVACLVVAGALSGSGAWARDLPGALVYLRDIAPDILQDMRYAGSDNFTGRPVPGYGAAECILTRTAAEALARVQKDLSARKLSLRVYDCYRPQRAVRAFMDWAADGKANPATKRFYPRLEKHQLVGLGYIARRSSHSRGTTVDLTIAGPSEAKGEKDRMEPQGVCTDPAEARANDGSVDMGTTFDCFDVRSHTAAGGLTSEQRRWRQVLLDAMARHGFRNYWREWWHFTYEPAAAAPALDVPIMPRESTVKR